MQCNDITFISIVAPVYNEEAVIGQFIERISQTMSLLKSYDYELILVDDGSNDFSLKVMKKYVSQDTHVRIIELMRNYGQTSALLSGIESAKGEVIITMDSDLQHFPEEIPLFLEKIAEGYDLVCGWRKDRKEGIIRRWPSRIANYFIRNISGTDIHDFGTTFRAYRKGLLAKIELFGEMHRFIPALASRLGGKIIEIPIQNIERPSGKSSYGLSRTYGVILDLLFLYFYLNYVTKPLRIFGMLAFFLFVPSCMIAFILTALILEKVGVSVEVFPLSSYRRLSFYTMRTDALDRFGTRIEKRFTKREIVQMMEDARLKNISFCSSVFWCAVGYKKASLGEYHKEGI
ncbi:MAG: glycosyltransferase family 2 protein [Nitrospirae bacterium]|nr:glycosyltransferase family 2 protein [Nitrospirota bacterium]MCL5976712.1 glycosyltransferase family 2 protein [Nitrospirota bacterium]